jgi:hypothetical protein
MMTSESTVVDVECGVWSVECGLVDDRLLD